MVRYYQAMLYSHLGRQRKRKQSVGKRKGREQQGKRNTRRGILTVRKEKEKEEEERKEEQANVEQGRVEQGRVEY